MKPGNPARVPSRVVRKDGAGDPEDEFLLLPSLQPRTRHDRLGFYFRFVFFFFFIQVFPFIRAGFRINVRTRGGRNLCRAPLGEQIETTVGGSRPRTERGAHDPREALSRFLRRPPPTPGAGNYIVLSDEIARTVVLTRTSLYWRERVLRFKRTPLSGAKVVRRGDTFRANSRLTDFYGADFCAIRFFVNRSFGQCQVFKNEKTNSPSTITPVY